MSEIFDLDSTYFEQHPVDCARGLIGAELRWDGCIVRIVETEAYTAEGDEACHTFFRPSVREFVEINKAGTLYVYLNYGVHWLFNVLIKGGKDHGFVLIRAAEPVSGVEKMRKRRPDKPDRLLASGPGRLTQALGITGKHHGIHFLGRKNRGISQGLPVQTVEGPRIGISKAQELPWRFGDPESKHLSRPFSVQS